jgi:DNA-directed RNA polymerase specialized sigma24 family protein
MAEKRARIDAILAVTGASALFTQDLDDQVEPAPEPSEQTPPEPPPAPKKIQREQAQQLGSLFADRPEDFRAALTELYGPSRLSVGERVMALTSDEASALLRRLA